MSRPLTMTDTAVEVGLSYERFRKVWPDMCAEQAFPAPFHGRCWDEAAVAAWKTQRSAARIVTEMRAPEPMAPPQDPGARARRARASLQQLRAG